MDAGDDNERHIDAPTATVSLPSDREIAITRTFNAPRTIVFDAWTKPGTSLSGEIRVVSRSGSVRSTCARAARFGLFQEILITRSTPSPAGIGRSCGQHGLFS